jgi:hypothetical protein
MSCENVQELISLLLDRKLDGEERGNVLAHLEACRTCREHLATMQELRAALRRMGNQVLPPRLHGQLRVMASHERMRQQSRASLLARAHYWTERLRLAFDNLMRPVALPLAGGILSALVMFTMLVPSLAFPHNFRNDVPLQLIQTNPALEDVMQMDPGDEIVVEFTVDERGSVQGYTVKQGKVSPQVENNLIMFSRFTPATLFGQPTWGKVLVSFRRSQISVTG